MIGEEARLHGDLMKIYNITKPTAIVYKNATGLVFQSLRVQDIDHQVPLDRTKPPISAVNYTATECFLSPCVKCIRASVNNGVYSEAVLKTWMEENTSELLHFGPLQPPWDHEMCAGADQSFGWDLDTNVAWSIVHSFPQKNIVGYVYNSEIYKRSEPDGRELAPLIYYANYSTATCGSPNNDTFACAMNSIAAALTKTLRNSGVIAQGASSSDLVAGHTFSSTTVIRIEWAWLALPLGVWLLGLITWIRTAFQTSRNRLPKWRDNPLPLVFLYREGEFGEAERVHDDAVWAYQELAKPLQVRLQPGGNGVLHLVRE